MSDALKTFKDRLSSEWLPRFCHAPHRMYSTEGFKSKSIDKLSEFDSYWFIRAIDLNLVTHKDGYFTTPQSKAKEQIFWEGIKNRTPRPINLWIEPIITIGALARLNIEFGWPIEKLGMQSSTWAFDLVGYGESVGEERIVCEVKKTSSELETLLILMKLHCTIGRMETEPTGAKEKNAYRKVQGIRRAWPHIFWALGPNGH